MPPFLRLYYSYIIISTLFPPLPAASSSHYISAHPHTPISTLVLIHCVPPRSTATAALLHSLDRLYSLDPHPSTARPALPSLLAPVFASSTSLRLRLYSSPPPRSTAPLFNLQQKLPPAFPFQVHAFVSIRHHCLTLILLYMSFPPSPPNLVSAFAYIRHLQLHTLLPLLFYHPSPLSPQSLDHYFASIKFVFSLSLSPLDTHPPFPFPPLSPYELHTPSMHHCFSPFSPHLTHFLHLPPYPPCLDLQIWPPHILTLHIHPSLPPPSFPPRAFASIFANVFSPSLCLPSPPLSSLLFASTSIFPTAFVFIP